MFHVELMPSECANSHQSIGRREGSLYEQHDSEEIKIQREPSQLCVIEEENKQMEQDRIDAQDRHDLMAKI